MKNILLNVRPAVIAIAALLFQLSTVSGQVATLQNWSNLYHGTVTTQQDFSYSVPTGSNANRILVVAVASSRSPNGSVSITLTYGGRPLELADGDMNTTTVKQHTALYYLVEAGLDAAADPVLSVSINGGAYGITDIWAAVFDYVNQTTPLTDKKTISSGTSFVSSISFTSPLTVNAYNQAVGIVSNHNNLKNKPGETTYADNWEMISDQSGSYSWGLANFSVRNGIAGRNIPNSVITDMSSTSFVPNANASMTALSMNYQPPPPPTIQARDITFSDVTSSSFTISWTPGDGTHRIVLLKAGSAVDSDPVYGTTYTASNLFGSGSEIGTDNFVVYNGSGNSVTVFNLDANTTYHAAIYEFSGPPGLEFYLTGPARGSQMTGPETALEDDYRTTGSGNWETTGIWQTFDGTSWVPAGTPPNYLSGVITIRVGHTVTVTGAVTADQVVVEAGGQVTVSSGITLTIADDPPTAVDCSVNGTLYNAGTVTSTGTLTFNSGSAYQHAANGGTIPTASWDANSTCLITGITNIAPSGFNQSFGNFTWNCVSQTITAAINSDVTVKGNLRITSTGSGKLVITDNSTSRTLTVSGDYSQTGGTFDFTSGSGSSSLYVAGNLSFTGGTITETSSSGSGSVIFNGTGDMQTFTSGGTFSNTIDFTVNGGAYLQMGTGPDPSFLIGSKGTFILSAGATLGITSPYGITTLNSQNPSGGNIRTIGTRTFNAGANYIYNGAGNQYTGNGLPLTVSNLVLSSTGGTVTFNAARNITNDFSITAGSRANLGTFIHTTGSLILGGVGQIAGSYGGATSGADYVIPGYFDPATGIVNNQPPDGTWTGAADTDWFSDENWIGGVPGSGSTAKISSYTTNQPVVSGTETALSGSLTINPGASLTINPEGSATIAALINNGTLNLNSDENGTASLIVNAYTDNGTENIQLYLTGSDVAWHYISSPVGVLPVTAVISSGDDPDASDLAAYYEELVTDDKNAAWFGYDGWDYQNEEPGGNTFSVLEVGQGYNYSSYDNATRIFGGTLNTSDVNKLLSYTAESNNNDTKGWNLLGNPFSSSLDWDQIEGSLPAGGEIANAIYFTRDNSVVSYVDGVASTTGVSGNIPPMQGFFVKANAPGQSLTLPASARVHSTQSRYKGNGEAIPLIRLKIESRKGSDEAVIRLDEKASYSFDSNLDAYKFSKTLSSASLWTNVGPVSHSINSIPFPEAETQIRTGVNIPESGTYRITASQLQEIGGYNVYLTDKVTGTTINLRNTPSLSFKASRGVIDDRFVIRITSIFAGAGTENSDVKESKFIIYPSKDFINIQTLSDEWDGKAGSVGLTDMTGRSITKINNAEFWKNSPVQIPAAGLRGVYFVRIESGLMRYVGKVMVR